MAAPGDGASEEVMEVSRPHSGPRPTAPVPRKRQGREKAGYLPREDVGEGSRVQATNGPRP